MQKQTITCVNEGMNRDIGISQLSENKTGFTFENHNIRITAVNDSTLYTITNEKGTEYVNCINGTLLGSCIVNNYIILFTCDTDSDYIYRLCNKDTFEIKTLYQGNLGFDSDHPIDAIGYYESEEVQKVYWVDGKNNSRFINVANKSDGTSPDYSNGSSFQFDFLGHINSIPAVKITKNYNKVGIFLAGIIQYFVTYYNKYGTETSIVWQSDLLYISMMDRGAKPDEVVNCSFDFTIDNVDTSYDYMRIYAIYRSSLNNIAEGRLIADLEIGENNQLVYSDRGNYQNYNAEDIHYIGGQNIIASTLDYKLDTLFLGDIKLEENVNLQDIKNYFNSKLESNTYEGIIIKECPYIYWEYKKVQNYKENSDHIQQINDSQKTIAGFKYREFYRFGIQFMSNTGEWTLTFWIGDKYCNLKPMSYDEGIIEEELGEDNSYGFYIAQATFNLDFNSIDENFEDKYKAFRLLVAETSPITRRILTQGVINPTMFNYKDRENNQPFSINSWLFRPRKSNIVNRHYDTLPLLNTEYAEMQGVMTRHIPGYKEDIKSESTEDHDGFFLIFSPEYRTTPHPGKPFHIWYRLIYYNTNSCEPFTQSDYSNILKTEEGKTLSTEELTGKEAAIAISKSNQCLKDGTLFELLIPYHFTDFKTISIGKVMDTNWDDAAANVITLITADTKKEGLNIVLNEHMLPTAEQYKYAKRASTNNNMAWVYVGLGVALAASIVASIFSFGAASAAVGAIALATASAVSAATATALGLAAASAASVLAAIGSAAAIATIADELQNNENALDIDKLLSYKGIYSLHDHSYTSKINAKTYSNVLLQKLFKDYEDIEEEFYELIGNEGNVYTMGGRLTLLDEKNKDTNKKSSSFYIDESIVTLNSPDLNLVLSIIDNSNNYNLELVGTIPINNITTDYIMYAELGLANTAQVIPGLKYSASFGELGKEGLVNGFLYQDSKWPQNWTPGDASSTAYILATAAVFAYKVFMWNRNTSWSLWIPGVKIKDVYNNELTSPAAKPIKKIFANYKYSYNTNYQEPYNLDIESPKVFNSDLSIIDYFTYNGIKSYYYGNLDTVVIPSEDYTLIADSNDQEFYKDPETGAVTTQLKDPIPLRYKSTPHAIIPLKWNNVNNTSTILPYIGNETNLSPKDMYELAEGFNIFGTPDNLLWMNMDRHFMIITVGNYAGYPLANHMSNTEKINYIIIHMRETLSLQGADWDTFTLDYEKIYSKSYLDYLVDIVFLTNTIFYNKEEKTAKLFNAEKNEFYDVNYKIINHDSLLKTERIEAVYDPNAWYATGGQPAKDFYKTVLKYSENDNEPIEVTLIDPIDGAKYVGPNGQFSKFPFNSGLLTWTQLHLSDWTEDKPYLFLGEFVKKDFNYSEWYGGTSDYALLQLNWNICSEVTNLNEEGSAWGDTYYLRWECLKTYPFSEEDVNSNVEVLSFMLESHINLDGRSDSNRGTSNLLNLRPSNTNIFNDVYNQQDNFFSYKVLDEKFNKNSFENQVIWSTSKSNLDNIDKWTDISAVNTLTLDGKLGKITKIINVNDSLLAFQDRGISSIEYNIQTALSTYEGMPLQMGNTGKVTGYKKVTDNAGCINKKSIVLTEAGIFFIDYYTKTLYLITSNEGIKDISNNKGFSTWFKDNILNTKDMYLNYDVLTDDLYISNNNTCLLYNVRLDTFTSFMDYINTPLLLNFNGESIAFQLKSDEIYIWKMFEGDYNKIYGEYKPYSIEYRINPSPYTDNIFTNYLYVADWTNPDTKSNDKNLFSNIDRLIHFDTVEAWNEYLYGKLKADTGIGIRPIKTKFRIWRGDIPKDGDTQDKRKLKGDRMRNPWIHLKFTKNTNDDNTKMTFHNLNIIYYN